MGSRSSRPFVGRGSTLSGACDDLTAQLQHHFGTHVQVRLSQPVAEPPLSPRARSPNYPGLYVALADMGDGRKRNVVLRRDPGAQLYYASD
jgi:hypothetical protein